MASGTRKKPETHTGYAPSAVTNYDHRSDKFYRWVWEQEGYTTRLTHEHADEYVDLLAKDELRNEDGEPYSGNHKRKTANAIEALFRWRAAEFDEEPWSPNVTFSEKTLTQADPFTKEERRKLREAALEYGTIPAYNDLSPEQRDRSKRYLAQRLGKPKEDVSPEDWKRVNQSWKIPSLVCVALDAGFRPVGIERANTSWARLEKGVLVVPPKDRVKNGQPSEIALTNQSVTMLQRWFEERRSYEKYDDSNAIWLNRQGNRYNSNTLNYLLDNLCEEAGIDQTNRNISWYSIRHSVGTYLVESGGLAAAQAQLRHKNPESTMRYAQSTPEERRDALSKL